MDENHKITNEESEEKNVIKESPQKVSLTGIIFLLVLILFCNLYLCYTTLRQTFASESIDSTNRVLIVSMEKDILPSRESDSEQVKNALNNGGAIRIKDSNEGYKNAFGDDYGRYGASDSSGYYYTKGAVLNYIASRGWALIQAPSSGLSDSYYFVK